MVEPPPPPPPMIFQSPMANVDALYQEPQSNRNFQSYSNNFHPRTTLPPPPPPPPPGVEESSKPIDDAEQHKRKAFNFRKSKYNMLVLQN